MRKISVRPDPSSLMAALLLASAMSTPAPALAQADPKAKDSRAAEAPKADKSASTPCGPSNPCGPNKKKKKKDGSGNPCGPSNPCGPKK